MPKDEILKRKKWKTLFILKLSIKDQITLHILFAQSMKKCWDILIKQFLEVKNNARKLFAKSHFFELKLKERSKVNNFMITIKKILNELVEFENIPSDNMVVEQVINPYQGVMAFLYMSFPMKMTCQL